MTFLQVSAGWRGVSLEVGDGCRLEGPGMVAGEGEQDGGVTRWLCPVLASATR